MHLWPIGTKPIGIAYARLRPFGSYQPALFNQAGAAWGKVPRQVSLRTALRYVDPPAKSPRSDFPYALGPAVADRTGFPWNEREDVQRRTGVTWGQMARMELRTRVGYAHLPAVEQRTAVPFAHLDPLARRSSFYYRHPPERERRASIPWALAPGRSVRADVPYRHPPRKERPNAFPWDDTQNPAPGVRPRPIDPPEPPPAPEPVYTPPPGDQVGLALYCPAFEGDGAHVSIKLSRVACPGIDRRIWTVNNSSYLKRVSDDFLVPCERASVTLDIESWAWVFRATLFGDDALALVSGVPGTAVEVELGINGQAWRLYLENFSRTRAHAEPAVQVEGRGLSIELGATFAAPASRFETDTLTARQLIEQELGTSSWTATPHPTFVDWTVDGEVYDYRSLTPIESISRILAAVRAVVVPDPVNRDILLMPRYPRSPWNWDNSPIDKQLAMSAVEVQTVSNDTFPLHRGIYVAGEVKGKSVQVRFLRTGTDGEPWMESISDPLITQIAAGRERGRNELASTGHRRTEDLEMPFLNGEGDPGLLLPGHLVEVTDVDGTYRAQVRSVTVSTQWTQAEGLVNTITPSLERYLDE